MSCNYLNVELFLLSLHLCLLPLSVVRLPLSPFVSISPMCFLALSFPRFLPPPPFSLSPLVSAILPFFSFLSVPCACTPVSQAPPSCLTPGFSSQSCRCLGKGWKKGKRPSSLGLKTPSSRLPRRGESPFQLSQPGSRELFLIQGHPELQPFQQTSVNRPSLAKGASSTVVPKALSAPMGPEVPLGGMSPCPCPLIICPAVFCPLHPRTFLPP